MKNRVNAVQTQYMSIVRMKRLIELDTVFLKALCKYQPDVCFGFLTRSIFPDVSFDLRPTKDQLHELSILSRQQRRWDMLQYSRLALHCTGLLALC